MFNFRALGVVAVMALLLTGCFNGSGNSGNSGNRSNETAESATTSFIAGLFDDTSDTAEPTSINDREFTFSEDEGAFDDLIEQQ